MRSSNRFHSARRACVRAVEQLESRTLLNATLSTAISPVSAPLNSTATTINLSSHFSDPTITGQSAVIIETPEGNIPVELFDSQAPQTVQNFLSYVDSGAYNGTIVHRLATNFVIQGGGYTPDGSHIPTSPPVPLEYGIANSTGTIAMARTSDPNSATSEWFINTVDNSQTLGPANDGHGYAVFGQVVYNGMQVVDAITSLQIVDDSAQNGAWNTLPVRNYSGSSTPSSVPPTNMVTTNIVAASPLTYAATSDNISLVTPSISNGTLSLNYVAGQSGIANVTVTATDLAGNVVSSTFKVAVGTTLGAGGAKQVRFTDGDGTVTTLALKGPGTADIGFSGSGITQTLSRSNVLTVTGANLHLSTLTLAGTTAATALNIAGHGGNKTVEVSGISTDGAIKTINAPTVALSGALSINGPASVITLGSDSGGSIHAAAIGRLVVRGAIASSTISTDGNITALTAGSLSNSNVFAGVSSSTLPASSGDFAAAATIGSVKVGRGGFAGSNIAAETLGRLSLGTIQTDNGGTPFGLAGHSLVSLVAVAGNRLHLKNITSEDQVAAALAAQSITPQDLVIRII